MDQVRWDKPGAGTWLLDSSHSRPAPGPIVRELIKVGLERGLAEGMALFGSPLKGMRVEWVNGRFYRRLVPIIGGDSDRPPPPGPVLWLAARLHPAFRREERKAKASFETKRWRAELARWESDWKPSLTARNVELTAVNPGGLDDAALADHVERLYDHVYETVQLHQRLHVSDMGPLGQLMVSLRTWGIPVERTFHALVDASPATRAPKAALRALADELRANDVTPSTVASLDEVRSASARAAALLDEYLLHHGWRLTTGYDIEDRCLVELPDVVVQSIRAAASASPSASEGRDAEAAIAALREEVPDEHRAEFDEQVEDARLSYGLRDENGPLTYEWPAGLLRRALLEAGRRLFPAEPDEVFELEASEVVAMLRRGAAAGPDPAEIARRRDQRRFWASLDAPDQLGPDEAPPPIALLPTNLALITDIVLTVVSSLEATSGAPPLTGTGIGTSTYRGTARVVHDADEALANLEPGDVLVAPYTAPTYNAVLSIAGALVIEEGGLLCHAAVIARELGLPAVVGAREAMSRIKDGATVEVDPARGTVAMDG